MKHQIKYNWVIMHYGVLPILENKLTSTPDLLILLQLHHRLSAFFFKVSERVSKLPWQCQKTRTLQPLLDTVHPPFHDERTEFWHALRTANIEFLQEHKRLK
jgi:hypothetical protein